MSPYLSSHPSLRFRYFSLLRAAFSPAVVYSRRSIVSLFFTLVFTGFKLNYNVSTMCLHCATCVLEMCIKIQIVKEINWKENTKSSFHMVHRAGMEGGGEQQAEYFLSSNLWKGHPWMFLKPNLYIFLPFLSTKTRGQMYKPCVHKKHLLTLLLTPPKSLALNWWRSLLLSLSLASFRC